MMRRAHIPRGRPHQAQRHAHREAGLIVEGSFRRLAPEEQQSLNAHLVSCSECAAELAAEQRLMARLDALRQTPGPDLDVSSRVRVALTGIAGPQPAGTSSRQLGWATAAALAGAAVSGGLLARIATQHSELLAAAGSVLSAAPAAVASLLRPVASIGASLLQGVWTVVLSLAPVGSALAAAIPLVLGALVAGTIGMMLTSAAVIGRDLLRARSARAREL